MAYVTAVTHLGQSGTNARRFGVQLGLTGISMQIPRSSSPARVSGSV